MPRIHINEKSKKTNCFLMPCIGKIENHCFSLYFFSWNLHAEQTPSASNWIVSLYDPGSKSILFLNDLDFRKLSFQKRRLFLEEYIKELDHPNISISSLINFSVLILCNLSANLIKITLKSFVVAKISFL